jgi:hypothetical protein
MAQVSLQVRTSLDLANARFKGRASHLLNANAFLLGLASYPIAWYLYIAGDTTISYELILEKFRSIEKPIDKYLTLRDLLRLAPRVYYDLLLKHTEEILPYIYTVSAACSSCSVLFSTGTQLHKLPQQQQQQQQAPCSTAMSCTLADALFAPADLFYAANCGRGM